MAECILAIDAGGTSLKYALMTPDGGTVAGSEPAQTVILPDAESPVLEAFERTAADAARLAAALGYGIGQVGICSPGPFDFSLGISHMAHKWPDAHGKPLAPVLRGVLGDMPVSFLHDSSAFILGEGLLGAGQGVDVMAGIMLGTGFGFGYMRGGRAQVGLDQRPRVILWNRPFRSGIVEDYVSRRAIREGYERLGGSMPGADVREIAEAARAGESAAAQTFARTGEWLAEVLRAPVAKLGCELVVLGGQIARSAPLLLPYMSLSCPVRVAEHLETAALKGIARFCALGHAATIEEA